MEMNGRFMSGVTLAAALLLLAAGTATARPGGSNRYAARMGEKVYDGRTGPWLAEARVVSPKAQAAETRAGGKIPAAAPSSYRLDICMAQPRPKTPIALRDGKGTVSVAGPDGKRETIPLVVARGHSEADVTLKAPGTYTFTVEIESGGSKGASTFAYTVK
jgi:hypothetical protein